MAGTVRWWQLLAVLALGGIAHDAIDYLDLMEPWVDAALAWLGLR